VRAFAGCCLLLIGCGSDVVQPLKHWSLSVEGSTRDVTLPARLPLPDHDADYTLTTQVALAPELRGQALTLAIPSLRAIASLRVNGEEATSLETWTMARYSLPSRQAWRVPARHTGGDRLALEITVRHRSMFSAWLITLPRLSATAQGDRAELAVRSFNEATLIALLGVGGLLSFIYMVSFLFDRRRTQHLWVSLQTGGAVLLGLTVLCVTQPLLGVHDLLVMHLTTIGAHYCGIRFTRAHFQVAGPPRAITWALLALAVSVAAQPNPFAGARWATLAVLLAALLLTFDVLRVLLGQLRGPRRTDAVLMLVGWGLFWALVVPDVVQLNNLGGDLGARGFYFVPASLCVLFLTLSVVLSRERILSFRSLEARSREVEQLNQELRRQIADRARQLAEAIGRLSTAPAGALEPGAIVQDRYRVIGQLGAGGMGTVYEVERLTDGTRLALKVLRGVADREALVRFAREAQIAAELHHPNVVAVLDVDVSRSGLLFLVMELVPGSSLAAQRERFGDRRWAVPILRQVAAALAAMHTRGIVHRDLKPANVLLDGSAVKVVDFGIASLADPSGADATVSQGRPLTRTGAFMGTPMYMAPELDRGAHQATSASDVFAFGLVAYELMSGRAPFSEAPVLARLAGRTPATPTPLDGELGPLVDRCMSLDPAARPSTSELQQALGSC
jgi:hypothetical protein